MNNSQRRVLYIAGALFVLMLLFPPFHYRATGVSAGYGLLFSPPHAWASLNVVQLVLQWVALAVVSSIALIALGRKPKDKP